MGRSDEVRQSGGANSLLTFQGVATRCIRWNRGWSQKLDTLLDPRGRRGNGAADFMTAIRSALRPGIVVMDVGGGKNPIIVSDLKASLRLQVIGLDISEAELNAAPPGCYDQIICDDVTTAAVLPEADLIVTRSVTEHVKEPSSMYLNIFRALRPGGLVIAYVPNKFALYALVNAAIPNRLSKILLGFFHWETKEETGFPALYRRCYPSGFEALLLGVGFRIVRFHLSYRSEYCNFFVPLHATELAWQLFTSHLNLRNLCEGFTVVAQKP
jgi:2-polyprenyl-3-methyl-5-hydroxy-6-metoxy-1,4-benzoquinol methylase